MNLRIQAWRARSLGALAAVLLLAAGAACADPPDRAIRLSYTRGAVSFLPAGDNDWVEGRVNRPLWIGDRLWTADGARAELQMGNAALRIAPQTSVSVVNFGDRIGQFEVNQGTVDLFVRGLGRDDVIEIDTPNLAFSLHRPGEYRIDVSADATTVGVIRGEGEAFGAQNAYLIAEGERYRFYGTDLSDYEPQPLARDAFAAWVAQRVSLEQRSVSLRYVSSDVIGYEDLDAHGTWRDVPQYGHVWFPNQVAADWAPYRFGHWAWVDPWGWTWIDDAPWGFAPFHYGRWANVDSRWCWVPGPRQDHPVYAPALVAFVGGPSFGVSVSAGGGNAVGWFPLGPGDVYRPAYNVSRDYFTRVNVTNTRVNVTNITNIYNNPTTNIRYTNVAVSNAVTAVPTQAFVQAQPVERAAVRVDPRVVQRAVQEQPHVVAAAPAVAPTRRSFVGSAPAAKAKPAEQVVERTVVAKQAPPPAPPPVREREQLLQRQPGKPLDEAELKKLAPAAHEARPNVKVVQPGVAAKPIPLTRARAGEKGAPTARAPEQHGQPPVAEAPKAGGAGAPTQARPGMPPEAAPRGGPQPRPEGQAKEAPHGTPPAARAPTARAPTPEPRQPPRPEAQAKEVPQGTPPATRAPTPEPRQPQSETATMEHPKPQEQAPRRPEEAQAPHPTPQEQAPRRSQQAQAPHPTPQEQALRRPEQAQAQRPMPQEQPQHRTAQAEAPHSPPQAQAPHPAPVAQAQPESKGGPPPQAHGRAPEKGPSPKAQAERDKEKQKEEGK
jgi:hypothetical protein